MTIRPSVRAYIDAVLVPALVAARDRDLQGLKKLTMTPQPTLSDAITAVEQSANAYQSAVTMENNDSTVAEGIQTKLDAQKALITADHNTTVDAAKAFNANLDLLVAAATAAKIPVPEEPPAQ